MDIETELGKCCFSDWDKEKFIAAWKLKYSLEVEKYDKKYDEKELIREANNSLALHTMFREKNEERYYRTMTKIIERAMNPRINLSVEQKRVLLELRGIDPDDFI